MPFEQNLKRLVLLAAFAAAAVLFVLLTPARSAATQAPAVAGLGSSFTGPAMTLAAHPVEEDDEGDDEEEADDAADDEGEEADRCESDDEAAEEACEERVEREEEELEEEELAEECRVEGAEATVATVPGQNQVLLTVRYETYEPSAVAVQLGLRGGKGRLDLGVEKVHFGRHGTMHATETVTDAQMDRVLAAKEFTVGVQAVNAPRFCRGLFERHLTAHHGSRWLDPTAAERAREAASKR